MNPSGHAAPPEHYAAAPIRGPRPAGDLRVLLRRRLRLAAPLLLLGVLLCLLCNLAAPAGPLPSRPGLLLQLAIPGLMGLLVARLCGSGLSLRALRALELLLFGLSAVYLAWLQCAALYEAWLLRAAAPPHEALVVRLALGACTGRWLLLIAAYGVLVPNTRRRCAIVLAALALMPLAIVLSVGLGRPTFHAGLAEAGARMAAALAAGAALALFACGRLYAGPAAGPDDVIGPYRLLRRLRSGGMGEVYLAEHATLKRHCAVKLIRPEQAHDPAVARRFGREARATAALRHPNAVTVHDAGRTDDGTCYYVMEYLPGRRLEDLVARDGPLPPARAAHLLRQVCAARAAHALGILHLDVKPGNVIVGDGDAVTLLDFGLAQELAPGLAGLNSSGAGEGAGSPQYMSPEQAEGRLPLDARADVYALGGLAYFLLTGRPPFERDSALQLLLAHVCDPVTPPSHLRPGLPAGLEALVLRCLEKDPAERPAGADAVARALADCARAAAPDADDPAPRRVGVDDPTPMDMPAVRPGQGRAGGVSPLMGRGKGERGASAP